MRRWLRSRREHVIEVSVHSERGERGRLDERRGDTMMPTLDIDMPDWVRVETARRLAVATAAYESIQHTAEMLGGAAGGVRGSVRHGGFPAADLDQFDSARASAARIARMYGESKPVDDRQAAHEVL